ncbi:response regulator [bacterium (Candidatus Gribaldobacteria) CG10_big_fil_rev_8_21_14_0_10_33_41]|nr:MAG: response regulator [bacterium (Candidatus Gribaldobacteria) CG10_big_fil_rev_8_21_14_0_10_33_41]PJB08641.1 MAG: response regulator [bacterium (Candidatus Gribaldobacteria) CG_4_9_14_3_um_filter_33_9]
MKKILIIEDEKILSSMYKEKFEMEGFEIFEAKDVIDGLKLAKKEKPDLVILDILLPGENGLSFLKAQKNEPSISKIPIIVFSNLDDPKTKEKADELGAKKYLIKANYEPRELVKIIKKYLE